MSRQENGKRNKRKQQYQQQRPERRPTRYTPIGKETARVVMEWHDVCLQNATTPLQEWTDMQTDGRTDMAPVRFMTIKRSTQ